VEEKMASREYNQQYYQKNKARLIAAAAAYQKTNRCQTNRKNQRWLKMDRKRNPERYAGYDRKKTSARKGVTQEWYEKQWKKQNGLCAICKRPETVAYKRYGTIRRLAIDHCHKTEIIRGLLCTRCNWALALMEEIEDWHERALAYLALWK
jgi:hypothetical protein